MQYQFILHEKNIVRVTSKQPPIPSFKPRIKDVKIAHEPSLVVTCRAGFFKPLPGCECF